MNTNKFLLKNLNRFSKIFFYDRKGFALTD